MLIFMTITYELSEYALQHQLPNFGECWWDHWILDVLICNWGGTYFGMKACEYFAVKHYSWRGLSEIPTIRGKVKRAVEQFTPADWTRFEWASTKDLKHYIAVVLMLFLLLQVELNCFYLKALLWIPANHWLNVYRVAMLSLFGLPATREAYQYLADPTCKRVGPHAWLLIANVMTETIICFKFGQNEFPTPAPVGVKVFWGVFLTMLVAYPTWQFGIKPWQDGWTAKKEE